MLLTANLTAADRAEIVRLHAAGASKSVIAERVGCTCSAVRSTITNLDDFAPRAEVVATVKVRPVREAAPDDPELAQLLKLWTQIELGCLAHALRATPEDAMARCRRARVAVVRRGGELWVIGRAPRPRDVGKVEEKFQRRASLPRQWA